MNRWLPLAVAVALVACSGSDDSATGPTGATTVPPTGMATTVNPTAGPSSATDRTTTSARPGASTTSTNTDAGGEIDPAQVPALRTLLDAAAPLRRFTLGPDTLGVWICHVGLDVTDPIYHPSGLRLDLDPTTVTAQLDEHVTGYFDDLSHGQYVPDFVAGGEVSIGAGETNRDCVDHALERAGDPSRTGPLVDAVVVVADAEHGGDQAGGWGRPGDLCPTDPIEVCLINDTGRATYIGASDFHPEWGPTPAVDLQEHEIGHSLGFPHSGDANRHTSALDLMSNSAAPRDVDGTRRHGPDTLAVNRLAAGWLPLDAVAVAGTPGGTFDLADSAGTSGTRLLVLPVDELQFVTVEVIVNTGVNDHLPESGVALHLIDQRPSACRTDSSTQPCVNELRRQTPLGSQAPHTDLLEVGETWNGEGWVVRVDAAGPGDSAVWTVTVTREDD